MSYGVEEITQYAFDEWANKFDFGTTSFKKNFNN